MREGGSGRGPEGSDQRFSDDLKEDPPGAGEMLALLKGERRGWLRLGSESEGRDRLAAFWSDEEGSRGYRRADLYRMEGVSSATGNARVVLVERDVGPESPGMPERMAKAQAERIGERAGGAEGKARPRRL